MSVRKGAVAGFALVLGTLVWAATSQGGWGGSGSVSAPSASSPAAAPFAASSSATAALAAACPGSPPAVPLGQFSSTSIPSDVRTDLRTTPASSLLFERKDLMVNMDYSYGIAIGDFDCDSKWDVSMFDSWGGRRARAKGAIGYISYAGATPTQITELDTWPEIIRGPNANYLLERHIPLDINGDQLPDIVGVANSHAAVIAYLNPGTGAPPNLWPRRYLNLNTPAPLSLLPHDMDGDGLTDVVVSMRVQPSSDPNPAVRGLVWLKNPGPASQAAWVSAPIGPSDDLIDPRNLQVADFDKNGKPDVFVADSATGIASTFLQDSSGQWTRHNKYVTAIHGHFGTTIDEDGDGVPEILQPGYLNLMLLRFDPVQKTWIARNLARFANEEKLILVGDVAVADLDGDNSSDIVFSILGLSTSGTDPRRGGIYMMRAAKNWQIERIAHTTSSVIEIKLVDMNRDGLVDIVADSEYPAQAVAIYHQKRLPGWWQ